MYYYCIYGLKVASEWLLPECLEFSVTMEKTIDVDVTLRAGSLPEQVRQLILDPERFLSAHSSSGCCFYIPHVASFCVTAEEVRVESLARLDQWKPILLGSCMGLVMYLRGRVAVHGAGLSLYHKGILITGESGVGKSTINSSLLLQGAIFVSDDVCAISWLEGKCHLNMAYPQLKLCRDAALAQGYDLDELIYINEERDKFAVRLKEGYLPEGEQLDFLFELVLADDEQLSFEKLSGNDKLSVLMRNIYRGDAAKKQWGMSLAYMQQCMKIVSQISVYRIHRPVNLDARKQITDFILSVVKE